MSSLVRVGRRGLGAAVIWAIIMMTASGAWALDPDRQIKQLHHTAWTLRDGLAFSGVQAVSQTPDGFLWLAPLAGGLYRFDGVQEEQVATKEIGNRTISALGTDARGNLWIGFTTPEIARLSNGTLTFFEVQTTGLRSYIFAIVPDPDGSIWVATRDRVHRFDGAQWQEIDDPWPLSSSALSDPGGVWALAVARDGTLWSKNLLGLYYLRRGARRFEQAQGYAGGMFDFATDRTGRLWTSDFSSKHFYSLPDLKDGQAVPRPQFGAAVPQGMVGVLRMDRDGALWNANRVTGGLYRTASFDAPQTVNRFTEKDGLTAEFPINVFEDREGNIWVPTGIGLHRFRNMIIASEPLVAIRAQAQSLATTAQAVFVYTGIRAVVADPDGDPGGRLIRIRPGHAPEVVDGDIGRLTALAGTADGSLIFSRAGEIFRWSDGVTTRIATPPHLAGAHVVNLVATSDGLVVSFFRKGVHQLQGHTWHKLTPEWVSANDTASVALDAQGTVWLFYETRMVRIGPRDRGEFRSPVGYIIATLPDPDGLIMVGHDGIARFDGSGIQAILASNAPMLRLSQGIAGSADQGIWIASASGILRMDRSALLQAFKRSEMPSDFQLYDLADGHGGASAADTFGGTMVAGPDGRIWTFMRRGLGWIDPSRQYRNVQPPPVLITSVLAQKLRYEMPVELSLASGTSQIQINYSAPSLTVPERVRFRYMLEGIDDGWVEAGSRRQAFYTGLPPGRHRFRVIAANDAGVWNEEGAGLTFTIAPTFVQSIWFKLLLAIVLAGLLVSIYRLLLAQQASRLHKRFQIRIAERERIARELHDTLLQGVQGLILRFDSVANRVAHDSELYACTQDALRRAEEAMAEGRDRVRELRTRSVADLGTSIVELAREIIQGDVPQVIHTEKGGARELHALVKDEMVLIASEAISNAVRHARASMLEIALEYGEAELVMSLRDDGIGIPKDAARPGHYGVVGMQERAQRIGGRLRISRREGGGTSVSLAVPARVVYSNHSRLLTRVLQRRRSTA